MKHGDLFGYHNIRFRDSLNRTYLMFEAAILEQDMFLFTVYQFDEYNQVLELQGVVRYNTRFFQNLLKKPTNGLRSITKENILKKHKQKPLKKIKNNVLSFNKFKNKKGK